MRPDIPEKWPRFNKTEHYEFKLNYKDILDSFPDVLETLDEPFGDSSAVPTYVVSRETKTTCYRLPCGRRS